MNKLNVLDDSTGKQLKRSTIQKIFTARRDLEKTATKKKNEH